MTTGDDGDVYLIHFDQPIGDLGNPKGHAQHYLGYSEDLERRQAEEHGVNAPAILRAVNEAGIDWRVVRTWPGTRDTERQLKLMRAGTRLCPECTEHPLTGAAAVARAAAVRRHREAQLARQRERAVQQARALQEYRAAVAEQAAERRANPYADGQQMARQWLAQQDAAARTADEIEAAHEYVTSPWAEMSHRSAAETERFRGYTEHIRAALAEFRGQEAEASADTSGGPAGAASSELEEEVDDEANTWLARDGGQVVEVETATGYPGRETSTDDGRPVAEAAARDSGEPLLTGPGWRDSADVAAADATSGEWWDARREPELEAEAG